MFKIADAEPIHPPANLELSCESPGLTSHEGEPGQNPLRIRTQENDVLSVLGEREDWRVTNDPDSLKS